MSCRPFTGDQHRPSPRLPPSPIRTLIHELHEAVVRAIDAAPPSVRVIVREVPTTHWAAGDVTLAERRDASP